MLRGDICLYEYPYSNRKIFGDRDTRHLCMNLTIQYLPYFFLGIMVVRYKYIEEFVGIKNKGLIMVLALFILACISLSNAVGWSFKGWYYLYSMLIYGAVTILLITCLLCCKIKLPPPKRIISEVWLSLDRCSMGVYIIHHILIMYLLQYREVKDLMVCHYVIMPFILFFFLLLISWGIVVLMRETALKRLV